MLENNGKLKSGLQILKLIWNSRENLNNFESLELGKILQNQLCSLYVICQFNWTSQQNLLYISIFLEKYETCRLIWDPFRPVRLFFLESLLSCTVIEDYTVIREIRVIKAKGQFPLSKLNLCFVLELSQQEGNSSTQRHLAGWKSVKVILIQTLLFVYCGWFG